MSSGKLDKLLSAVTGYQTASLLIAAAELDLWTVIDRGETSPTAAELAKSLRFDLRVLSVLLDALATFGFLRKKQGRFSTPEEFRAFLESDTPETLVPMFAHWGTCQRAWSQLGYVVKTGAPAPKVSGVLGPLGEYRAFILGMNSLAVRTAPVLAEKMKNAGLLRFKKMIDLGGASGTWTIAFLRANLTGRGLIFDLPPGIDEAKKRLAAPETADVASRISTQAGDFYRDGFPKGGDFHWISAIIHQQGTAETRAMFASSFRALPPGGRIAVRDLFPTEKKPFPPTAALFAVNMATGTASGKVYTREEAARLLTEAGFNNPRLAIDADDMTAVMVAEK